MRTRKRAIIFLFLFIAMLCASETSALLKVQPLPEKDLDHDVKLRKRKNKNQERRSVREDFDAQREHHQKKQLSIISASTESLWLSANYQNPFKVFYAMIEGHLQRVVDDLVDDWKPLAETFECEKPRHFLEGVVSAAENVALGCIEGSKMIWQCIADRKYAKGVAVLPYMMLLGFKTAALQLIRGVVETPKMLILKADNAQESWKSLNSHWTGYHLDQENAALTEELEEELRSPHSTKKRTEQDRKRGVKDKSYYQLLQVSTNATTTEIKRAYYKRAMKLHPDKNPSNERAVDQFRELSHAYQILANPETRGVYDMEGPSDPDTSLSSTTLSINSYTFIAVFFGSYLVEAYVGELAFGYLIDSLLNGDDDLEYQVSWDLKQERRVVDIALHLRKKLSRFCSDDLYEREFRLEAKTEATRIGLKEFGEIYLFIIGKALKQEVEMYRSQWWEKAMMSASDVVLSVRRVLAFQKTRRIMLGAETWNRDFLHDNLEHLIDTIWEANENDITKTLASAVEKVLDDDGNSCSRQRRAEGLVILGETFMKVGGILADEKKKGRSSDLLFVTDRFHSALWEALAENPSGSF